ncbi:hypothetical protein LCGC14_2213150 [marine sediment metagenome]|uniref:Poly A polymerase head domain-containing protein n=1 Tax=marine sediment metagenome TaxID=412755 RepID=A0A0F9E0N4_9ZZZZ
MKWNFLRLSSWLLVLTLLIFSHNIFAQQYKIDKPAFYVIEKLRVSGFIAFLVGGSVRDLLLNVRPKDFDISTSAKPEEIKKMYPKLEFDGTDLIISDPSEVVKILFGPETRPSNVDSAEEIIDLIQRFPSKKAKEILDIAKIRAKSLASKGIKLPPELT